jgi:hypothetical protein
VKANKKQEQLLEQIAKQHLFIDTLETQSSDRLDFHDVSVWGVKAALEAAYEAGLKAAQTKTVPIHTQS